MSNLLVINKGNDHEKGAGLPFYKEKGYIMSYNGNDIAYQGRLTPQSEIPSFQIWVPEDTFVSMVYERVAGGSYTVNPSVTPIPTQVIDNGQTVNVFSMSGIELQSAGQPQPYPPCGLYTIALTLSDGVGGSQTTYYSAEISLF